MALARLARHAAASMHLHDLHERFCKNAGLENICSE